MLIDIDELRKKYVNKFFIREYKYLPMCEMKKINDIKCFVNSSGIPVVSLESFDYDGGLSTEIYSETIEASRIKDLLNNIETTLSDTADEAFEKYRLIKELGNI